MNVQAESTHTTVCCAVEDDLGSWRQTCTCRHFRSRHAAVSHDGVPVEADICTGRNLAGACLWAGCGCSRFTAVGVVYLLHFDRPYMHAEHYTGWTTDLDTRLAEHAAGRGARLLAVIVSAGIGWQLARTWPGTRSLERALKRQGGASRRCPICGVNPRTLPGGDR